MTKRLSNTEFINRANDAHNFSYDYSKTNYISSREKIVVTCPSHGDFIQYPNNHLQGKGCPKCTKIKHGLVRRLSTDNFILYAEETHSSKYDYSEVVYIRSNEKVKIICPHHGSFEQTPNAHLSGQGCTECANNKPLNTKLFIAKSVSAHGGKYNYVETIYVNARTPVTIICNNHGNFEQLPHSHLAGHGCPVCTASKKEKEYIDSLGKGVLRQHKIYVDDSYVVADGFDPTTNTVYEFHGDYWHGNPDVYKGSDINRNNGKTFQELYEMTCKRTSLLKKHGYNVIEMWENNWTHND